MTDKQKILEAWIMVEHLSEGDINDNDKSILLFDTLKDNDYYSMIKTTIAESKIGTKKQSGLVLYFDIFSFNDVVDILREQYSLKPTDEEITSGKKFSFALYFDKEMQFMKDMTFFTESAYIRYFKEVPHESDFREFEEKFKKQLEQDFDYSSKKADESEIFNQALLKTMQKFNISPENCRLKLIENISVNASNLHSFFIDDLEKAKTLSTDNLNYYLFGDTANRVNLDSKKDSANFNPSAFEEILQPDNYPLGRFPGNTKFALFLMQQAAVNIATGYDNKTIRSVNGPPGTGKTTLLKDIFAELIVKQARDIVKMPEHTIVGTKETVYYGNASIGVLPESISENSIVVASSNNSAVQNIVNELPLIEGQIDDAFADEIKKADYFIKVANADSSLKEDTGDENPEAESMDEEYKFWGLFSLEGGKSNNMDNIISKINSAVSYLEEEYIPDKNVYQEFIRQYNDVKEMRHKHQQMAVNNKEYLKTSVEIDRLKKEFSYEYNKGKCLCDKKLLELKANNDKVLPEIQETELKIKEYEAKKDEYSKILQINNNLIQAIKLKKPGFFASKSEKDNYNTEMESAVSQITKLTNEIVEINSEIELLKKKHEQLKSQSRAYMEEEDRLKKEFMEWFSSPKSRITLLEQKKNKLSAEKGSEFVPLDMQQDYDKLHLSNPWFDENYRVAQSKLFISALKVRKQFLYENRKNVKAAVNIWNYQNKHIENKKLIEAAWNWINMTVPVISSTFASFSRMCRNLGENTLGHLFIDEAGQAVPQASVGAIFRSRHVMVVGDPSQIKPVLTLDSSVLSMLGRHFEVTEKYLSESASTQTLVDAASRFGFYREKDMSEDSWIGIPLWVHRRCAYPMFTISNEISYNGFMVQGKPENGKTGWFDVSGKADKKYVEEQGEFLYRKLEEMIKENPEINDKNGKDIVYVISPFKNVAFRLAQKLKKIGFTRCDSSGKSLNVGTIHTFQGKEAPIVFMVLGADEQSKGAAAWAVSEPNMMNVAATRAKKEFYVIGDKKLYLHLGSEVAACTYKAMEEYRKQYPELVDNDVSHIMNAAEKPAEVKPETAAPVPAPAARPVNNNSGTVSETERIEAKIYCVRQGRKTKYAYATGNDGKKYTITEDIFSITNNADEIIQQDRCITFIPVAKSRTILATDIRPV